MLSLPVAAWMAYLIFASDRFGRRWIADDPQADRIASIADHIGDDPKMLVAEILAFDAIFDGELAGHPAFRIGVTQALAAMLSADPASYLREILNSIGPTS